MADLLVVEDDEHLRAYLRHVLERADHEVAAFGDGTAAWAHLERAADGDAAVPDAAVVDVMLPGLSGFSLVQRIEEHPALTDVAVLVVSARGREADVHTGFERGAIDYLVKPFDADELLTRLGRALR